MIKIDIFQNMAKLKHFIYVLSSHISILLLFSLITQDLNGQIANPGMPYIQNYPPKEYGSDNENFSIVQDKRGVVFIGNENGIMEFNNHSWHHINVPGWPYLDIDASGKVYIGSYNDFGILSPSVDNRYAYKSLKDKLLKKADFGLVHNVVTLGDQVFFETESNLYLFHHDYIQLMGEKNFEVSVFKAGDAVFLNRPYQGLSIYSDNRIEGLPLGMFFREKKILDIIPFDDKYLIRTENDPTFWLYDLKTVEAFETEADDFITNHIFTDIAILSDGLLAIGTRGNGIVVINRQGEIVKYINKTNGLYDNYVHALYPDKTNNLWACLQNGISRIEYPASYSFLNINNGIEGNVLSIHPFNDLMYVGTVNGVYAGLSSNPTDHPDYLNNEKFQRIAGLIGIAHGFFEKSGQFFAYTSNGIYKLDGREATLKFNVAVNELRLSKNNPEILYAGCPSAIKVLKISEGDVFEVLSKFKINGQVRSIAEDAENNIWFGTNFYGLYMLKEQDGTENSWDLKHYNTDSLLPSVYGWVDVFSANNALYFSSETGVYEFNPTSWELEPGNPFGLDFSDKNKWLHPITQMADGHIYTLLNNNLDASKQLIQLSFTDDTIGASVEQIMFQKVNDISIETIYPGKDSLVWLGGVDGLVRIDRRQKPPAGLNLSTYIQSITLSDDTVLYVNPEAKNALKKRELLKIKNDVASIKLSYVCPAYIDGENIEYTYFLENYDENWSEWGKRTAKEYTSLPSGKYTFFVKARDIYGNETESDSLSFVMLAPFYFTTFAFIIYAIVLITFSIMMYKVRSYQFAKEKSKLERIIKERTEDLVKEFERAEDLLVNMLPQKTAQELKLNGKATTRKFDLVSVMFSDIQGFTEITELIEPEILITKLDEFFQKVDAIIDKYQVEKIKTIGDGYMCAGGIPETNRTNPVEVVLAALELREFMTVFEFDEQKTKHLNWGLRIGIHTGSVIAGVIGDKKLSYDIWGVTVNNASRMESNGVIEKVNISQATYELIKDYFECEFHGTLTLKSGNVTEMYFVNGLKSEYAADKKKITPNDKLMQELAELRYLDLYDFMVKKLEQELPSNLYYHNLKHTIDVTNMAEVIAQSENISKEEQVIVKTAALLHDSGFSIDYENHEYHSVKLAKKILPAFNYNVYQIEQICQLIMATKFPPVPKNHLEEIICDADLDYLGRKDFIPVSRNLFMELYERKRIKSVDEWLKTQINFIEKHTYFTDSAKNSRDVNKNQQLDNLRQMDFLSSFF